MEAEDWLLADLETSVRLMEGPHCSLGTNRRGRTRCVCLSVTLLHASAIEYWTHGYRFPEGKFAIMASGQMER